jgi:hypothetical protein
VIGFQRLRKPAVRGGPLTRQLVVPDRLADQRVPEPVTSPVDHQHAGRHRGPQRRRQRTVVQPAGGGQQLMADPTDPGRRRPQHRLRRVRQPGHPGQQQVPQRLGQPRLILTIQQHLGEERIALAAPVDLLHQARGGFHARYGTDQRAHPSPLQPEQLQAPGPGDPVQLRQRSPQRVGAFQLIGPIGHHAQQPPGRLLVVHQKRQQVEAGPVDPVDVLDHEHHRLPRAQPSELREHLFEQPGPGGVGIGLHVHRQQLAQGVPVPAHGRGERGKRQAAAAEVHAPAVQHLGLDAGGELPDQPRLADTGLAADQYRGRGTPAHLRPGLAQSRDLGVTPHQHRTDGRHPPRMPGVLRRVILGATSPLAAGQATGPDRAGG